VVLENTQEATQKLNLKHDVCDQCAYLTFCNAGWYHYKLLTAEELAPWSAGECSGYRKLWDYCQDRVGNAKPRSDLNHLAKIRETLKGAATTQQNVHAAFISECQFQDHYVDYVHALSTDQGFILTQGVLFGKSLLERLWVYDSVHSPIKLPLDILLADPNAEAIIGNALYGNYRFIHIPATDIYAALATYPDWRLSLRVRDALAALAHMNATPDPYVDHDHPTTSPHGLIIDDRNDELFRFLLHHPAPNTVPAAAPFAMGRHSLHWLDTICTHVDEENRLQTMHRQRQAARAATLQTQ
jgi:hypothetical protein